MTDLKDLDPLEPVLPPAGVRAARVAEVSAAVAASGVGRVDVAGLRGCATAAVSAAVASSGRRIVLVANDGDGARRLAEDLAYFTKEEVLVLADDETSPYAQVNPDRRAAMARMATLSRLASTSGADTSRVLVTTATGLARKVVPRSIVRAHTHRIVAEDGLDRDWLIARLAETGYIRVPLVEDPGSFAVRGALLDVWPPNTSEPVRVELYGDLVVSIKPFDAMDQKTRKDSSLAEVLIAPVREAILSREHVARARDRITQLADAIDMPTLKARALVDDVTSGRAFFGADAYVPAFYDKMESLFAYVADDAVVMLDDPPAIVSTLREALGRARADIATEERTPHFLVTTFFEDEDEVAARLEKKRVVALHRTAAMGAPVRGLDAYQVVPVDGGKEPLDLAARDHDDLARAVK
ncbi:MAG TPA: transcription-repair coupling factor, partial [Polyangiaceae bacterium]